MTVGPGDCFGEMALLLPNPARRSATVTAESDMRLLVLTSREFSTLSRMCPASPRRCSRWLPSVCATPNGHSLTTRRRPAVCMTPPRAVQPRARPADSATAAGSGRSTDRSSSAREARPTSGCAPSMSRRARAAASVNLSQAGGEQSRAGRGTGPPPSRISGPAFPASRGRAQACLQAEALRGRLRLSRGGKVSDTRGQLAGVQRLQGAADGNGYAPQSSRGTAPGSPLAFC